MKNHLLTFILLSFISIITFQKANAQISVGYHQSALPFIGLGYTISERFTPELRLGTDRYFEDVALEGVLNYSYLNREDYQLYAGLGIYLEDYGGAAVVPFGAHFYPFQIKRFGFHVEAAPIIGEGYGIFRGSWGIRYRFIKEID